MLSPDVRVRGFFLFYAGAGTAVWCIACVFPVSCICGVSQ